MSFYFFLCSLPVGTMDFMAFDERLAKAPCASRSPQRPEFKPSGLSCCNISIHITQQFVHHKSSAYAFRERERLEDQDLFIAILGSWSRHAELAGPTSKDKYLKCYQTAASRGLLFLMRPHALQSQSLLHNNVAYNVSWPQGLCNEHSKAADTGVDRC